MHATLGTSLPTIEAMRKYAILILLVVLASTGAFAEDNPFKAQLDYASTLVDQMDNIYIQFRSGISDLRSYITEIETFEDYFVITYDQGNQRGFLVAYYADVLYLIVRW